MKNIYCIRHGLALHNVLGQEIGSKAYFLEKCFDAPLVDKGILQAKELAKKWDNLDKLGIAQMSTIPAFLCGKRQIYLGYQTA